MTVQTLPVRRSTTSAVQSRETVDWKTQAVCRNPEVDADPEDFFTTTKAGQDRARSLCATCPVIVECLRDQQAKDEDIYRWGIGGGLSAAQRRALGVEARLGQYPDLESARLLISPRWSYRLRRLMSTCYSLEGMVRSLAKDGLNVDTVTVRVAVWWMGGTGSRMTRLAPSDPRGWSVQLREDYADMVVRLAEMKVRHADIAAYLGISGSWGAKAVGEVVRAERAAAAQQVAA
ncbi:WhiB family transcriptional regulator [Streptomyces sp. NPDC002125]